jgi:hypothetical protein
MTESGAPPTSAPGDPNLGTDRTFGRNAKRRKEIKATVQIGGSARVLPVLLDHWA